MLHLRPPFEISSRLLPAVKIAGATLSCGISGQVSKDGRDVYEVWIDLPDGSEHEITDLRSGCGGGSVVDGMTALLSFLGAAAESRQYRERRGRLASEPGDNEDLFAPAIVDWAAANSDEISLMELEIEETPDCVVED